MSERNVRSTAPDEKRKPTSGARRMGKYIKPEIITSSAEELLHLIGSARACSGFGQGAMGWDQQDLNP